MSALRPDLAHDWPYIQNGAVTLFKDRAVLDRAVELMRVEGYSVHEVDCGTEVSLAASLSAALDHGPLSVGLGLDALNDVLGDVLNEQRPRMLLVLERFQGFWKRDRAKALALLDIIEGQSRFHLLFGHRLVAFVRTGDPTLHIEGLGGRSAQWNPKEWLMKSRGA